MTKQQNHSKIQHQAVFQAGEYRRRIPSHSWCPPDHSGSEPSPGFTPVPSEETLIVDVRALIRPAQQVEDKLISLSEKSFIPLSHVSLIAGRKGRGYSQ
jgi:hypothetical protein